MISCAAIFNTFPTDQGMCCVFNMPAAQDMFVQSEYTKMVTKLQNQDNDGSFLNTTLPDWYVSAGEPFAEQGSSMGLNIMLDAHTNLLSENTVFSDYEGFKVLISSSESFPLVLQKGFEVKPGMVLVLLLCRAAQRLLAKTRINW